MTSGFFNVVAVFMILFGTFYLIAVWRWEKFEFKPYMEAPYWTDALRQNRWCFRWLGLPMVFCAGVFAGICITSDHRPDLFELAMFHWPACMLIGFRIRAHRIEQLLDRESNRPHEDHDTPNPRSRLTTPA